MRRSLKRPAPNGATVLVLTPLQLVKRLCPLVVKPGNTRARGALCCPDGSGSIRSVRRAWVGLAVLVAAGLIAAALWPAGTAGVAMDEELPAPSATGAAVQPEQPPTRPAATAAAITIEGDVSDAFSGAPVRSAKVSFAGDDGRAHLAQTDVHGQFVVEARGRGPFFLASVTAAGFQPLQSARREASALVLDGPSTGHQLLLIPWVERRGVVEDLEDRRIEGATVAPVTPRESATAVITNARGEFTYAPLVGERWVIRHPGFVDLPIPPSQPGDAQGPWHYELVPIGAPDGAHVIHGVVLDDADAGVAGAQLTARAVVSYLPVRPAQRAVTDVDGRFELRADALGEWRVQAQTDFDEQMMRVIVDGGVTPLELRLQRRRGTLAGRVTGPAGVPVEQFEVTVFPVDPRVARFAVGRPSLLDLRAGEPVRVQRFSGPTGEFRISGLRPEVVGVRVDTAAFVSAVRAVELVADGEARCDVALEAGATVTGVVSSAKTHAPIARARVRLVGARAGPVRTGPDGSFVLSGLPAGPRNELFVQGMGKQFQPLQFPVGELKTGFTVGPLTITLSEGDPERSLEIIGIGVQTGGRGEELKVLMLHPSGGARSAGVEVGDVIIAVEGEALTDQQQVFARLRGAEGSLVWVTVQRGPQQLDFRIVRRRIAF